MNTPCPKCGTPLRFIPNHSESAGYGYCDHCNAWKHPTKDKRGKR